MKNAIEDANNHKFSHSYNSVEEYKDHLINESKNSKSNLGNQLYVDTQVRGKAKASTKTVEIDENDGWE